MAISSDTWKKILLFGSPALIASLVGLYYYYHRGSNLKKEEEPKVEETPLETAVALKNRGNRNFKVGRYAKAVECYTAALEQCPATAIEERATFYQNRAAARENLGEITAAVEDCTAALELLPTYLKALSRRARLLETLHEKNEPGSENENYLTRCLYDITACCLLERLQNGENIVRMDRVLKLVGQKMAKEESPKLPRTLPSPDFITFYLSSWSCNPFTLEAMKVGNKPVEETKATDANDSAEKENDHQGDTTSTLNGETTEDAETKDANKEFTLPKKLATAYEKLEAAFERMQATDYEASYSLVSEAVKNFNASANVNLYSFEKSRFGIYEKPESARARALLLEATYKALAGEAEEAKSQFLSIGETIFAHPSIRVNALIKAAALFMTLDQDISGCMYSFKQAQTLCPDCPDVYLHRGQINLLSDNFDASEKDFNEAVKLKPEFSVAQAQRLYLLYRKALNESNSTRAEELSRDFKKLVKKFPSCVETHSLYAQLLTERGDFEEGDAEFARIMELSPKSGMTYAHRGLLQLRWKQDSEAAEEWFKRGIEVDPRCELVWELRGQLAMERGDLEKAEEYFQHALEEARTTPDRSHLFGLREGVRAQIHAAEAYGISLAALYAELKGDVQQKMASMMSQMPY